MSSMVVNNDGSIQLRVYAGINPTTGNPRQLSKRLPKGSSKDDIKDAINELESRAALTKNNPASMTVQTLIRYYIEQSNLYGKSKATQDTYRRLSEVHIFPKIGNISTDALKARDFAMLYPRLAASLSNASVLTIHAMLSGCFSWAVSQGFINSNPMVGVKPPRVKRNEAVVLRSDEIKLLINRVKDDIKVDPGCTIAVVTYIALVTGMRRGEICGLRISDVGDGVLKIRETAVETSSGVLRKAPKTASGVRNINITCEAQRMLDKYKSTAHSSLKEMDLTSPFFVNSDGSPVRPHSVSLGFKRYVREIGLRSSVHLHTLRHTHATMLIEAGVNPRTIQERLGHADIKTTLGIYGHVLPGRDAEAAQIFDGIIGG